MFLGGLASTLAMVGLVWFVQTVHYPLFELVGAGAFPHYEQTYLVRAMPVLRVFRWVELVTAVGLVISPLRPIPRWLFAVALGLLVLIWVSTFALQVPQHEVLRNGFNADAHQILVQSNWIRTIAWSLRGALFLWMTSRLLPREPAELPR